MRLTRTLLTLALAACCSPAMAQVPAMAGAPTDRPMEPEPGMREGTDRTLSPEEADLPQADVLTLSEQRELEANRAAFQADFNRLDRDYADLERQAPRMNTTTWTDVQARRQTAQSRWQTVMTGDATVWAQNKEQLMRDYSAYNEALLRAQLSVWEGDVYNARVRDRMTWYDVELNRLGTNLRTAPEGQRAERAYQLIRLRRQYDDLAARNRRLNRAPVAERDALRRQFNNDLTRFDTSVRTSGWYTGPMTSGLSDQHNGR